MTPTISIVIPTFDRGDVLIDAKDTQGNGLDIATPKVMAA